MHIKLTERDLKGKFPNEYEAAKAAQDGNDDAWMLLWGHYRPMLISRICHAKGFTSEELESEAIALFAHKLELFDRDKVTNPEGYSMHSWLFLGAVNLNSKLIRQRKKEVHLYNEQVSAVNGGGGGLLEPLYAEGTDAMEKDEEDFIGSEAANFQRAVNQDIFNYYNPERIVVESLHEDDAERVKAFYAKLTDFERSTL
jgi:DNA-directed RNA polymerase specialized sigma24 family protein